MIDMEKKVLVINPENSPSYSPKGHVNATYRHVLGSSHGCNYLDMVLGNYGANGRSDLHAHSNDQIGFVLEGSIRISSHGNEQVANKEDLIYIPQGVEHQTFANSNHNKFIIINTKNIEENIKHTDEAHEKKSVRVIKPNDIKEYIPDGHDDTYNRILIGVDPVCDSVEIIFGKFGKKGTAHPHAHPYDQIVFMLEGINKNISNGVINITGSGEIKYIPGNLEHQSFGLTDTTKFLLIYAPPRSFYK